MRRGEFLQGIVLVAFLGIGSGARSRENHPPIVPEWIRLSLRTRVTKTAFEVLRANRSKILFNPQNGRLSVATPRGIIAPLMPAHDSNEVDAFRVVSYRHGAMLSFQYIWTKTGRTPSLVNLERTDDGFFDLFEDQEPNAVDHMTPD